MGVLKGDTRSLDCASHNSATKRPIMLSYYDRLPLTIIEGWKSLEINHLRTL